MRYRAWVILAFMGILVIGVALRLYALGDIPVGMDHDEGLNTLDAFQIIDGWRPVFLPRNNGREPLFMYIMAGSLALFGPTLWAVRLTGALAGITILPAQFLMTRGLPIMRPRLTALVSMAVVAVTFWPISKAHQALRAGLLPLWVTLMLWAWWQALSAVYRGAGRQRLTLWAALAGVFIAAAVYTHLTGRFLPILIVVSAVWVAVRERTWRPIWLAVVVVSVVVLLSLPQILYFVDNPEMIGYRANQASIFNPDNSKGDVPGLLAENAVSLALMYTVRGTLSWSENIAGRPIFDPLLGVAFLIGCALLGRDLLGRRGRAPQALAVLLLATLLLMLAPSWLSERAPHYGRLTGIWPVLFLLPALGLTWVGDRLDGWRQGVGMASIIGVLVISGAWSAYDFFIRYPEGQRLNEPFRLVNMARGLAVADLVAEGPTYLSLGARSQSVTRFFNIRRLPGGFDLRAGLVFPPDGVDARYVFEPGEREAADAFAQRWPQARRIDLRTANDEGILMIFRLARDQWPLVNAQPTYSDRAVFGDYIQLVAHDVTPRPVRPGAPLAVTLLWAALAPTERDLNFFVHVVTPDGRTVGQYDGAPLRGSYGTHQWQPGERILQRVEIPIARDAAVGPATVRVGWYDWRDGARLAVPGDDDAAFDIDQIEIGP